MQPRTAGTGREGLPEKAHTQVCPGDRVLVLAVPSKGCPLAVPSCAPRLDGQLGPGAVAGEPLVVWASWIIH